MLFVEKNCCPEYLNSNKNTWTSRWIAYYAWEESSGIPQPSKPSYGHWRDDRIRIPLIENFHNNCGYCGDVIPTPIGSDISKGDVDHFLPKAIFPEKTYEWENYIWSCKPCNQLKGEFHDDEHPLLNPCSNDDCSQLVYIQSTGQYVLNDSIKNDYCWKKRLQHTERKTMINADEICKKRKLRVDSVCQPFQSIANNKKILDLDPNQSVINVMNRQIEDDLQRIKKILEDAPDFSFLLSSQYEKLLIKFPQVKSLLLGS